jgi:hypothetical protein
MRHTLLFLLAFWTFALLPAPTVRAQSESHLPNSAPAESFCEQFEAITNAAPLSFKPLRGKLEFIDEWKGKQALPGTANCIAFGRRSDASYMCSTPIVEGEAHVHELFDTLKSQVQKCLGSGWTANDYTTRRGDPGTEFWKDGAAYDVHVAVKSRQGNADKAEITLTVSRP